MSNENKNDNRRGNNQGGGSNSGGGDTSNRGLASADKETRERVASEGGKARAEERKNE